MTNPYLERAQQLLQINRTADAETELRKALAENPNEAMALALLAECYVHDKKFAEAVEMAQKAVAAEAGEPLFYYVLGKCSFYNKDIARARLAINEGQRLDPGNADFFMLRSQIEFYQQNWEQALREANRGLELDPESVSLVNLRAQALVKLNRKEDASATMDYALHKAPENSYSHSNKGWVSIERGQYDGAQQHFLEALRLDPGNDHAREGLKEAIKAKNPVYRVILKYFLWMNKMQDKYQWGFIIGLYVLYRIALRLAENVPELAPVLYPIIMLYVLFAFSTWIAKPISNLFLRLHPVGKHALSDDEKLGSNLTGAAALTCAVCFAFYFAADSETAFRAGLVSGIMLIPIGGTFSIPPQMKARKNLAVYAIVLAVAGAIWVAVPGLTIALGIFGLGVFAYGGVANYLISKAGKEFF